MHAIGIENALESPYAKRCLAERFGDLCARLFGNQIYTLARLLAGTNPARYGIRLRYRNIPKGLQKRPFVKDFSAMLLKMSNGEVDIVALNSFTVGSFRPGNLCSRLIDPRSKYKDMWFGVYLILDDPQGKGRRFLLRDTAGDPADVDNINAQSVIRIPELDQKLIVYTTRQGQRDYTWEQFERDFYWLSDMGQVDTHIDKHERTWQRVRGNSITVAAVTDVSRSAMKLFSSIRVYAGLPDSSVYRLVHPWHPITIQGCVLTRYFAGRNPFWALVYYNGTSFPCNDGTVVDTWRDTDLAQECEHMFNALDIGCLP